MKWKVGIMVLSLAGMISVGLSVINFSKVKKDADVRLKVMNIRENISLAVFYYVMKDPVLTNSFLQSAKKVSREVGYGEVSSLIDSMETAVKNKESSDVMENMLSNLKSITDRVLLEHETKINILYPVISFINLVAIMVMAVISLMETRNNIALIEKTLLNLRLGILANKVELSGDFKNLGGIITRILDDMRRVKVNARKIARS